MYQAVKFTRDKTEVEFLPRHGQVKEDVIKAAQCVFGKQIGAAYVGGTDKDLRLPGTITRADMITLDR